MRALLDREHALRSSAKRKMESTRFMPLTVSDLT